MTAERVLARVRAAAGPRAVVELYGSAVYAPAHASDVDVLVANDDPDRLAAALALARLPTSPPRLTGRVDGIAVDVTVVTDDDANTRTGPRDAALLVEVLRAHDDVFQALWPEVRRFVKLRALGQNGLGWFGSFGWALLLAVPVVHARVTTFDAWLQWLARLSPHARIDLDGVTTGDAFFVATPSPPIRDVARLSKRAVSQLLAEARAAIDHITDIRDEPPPGTALVITGEDEASRGRYDGNARGLLRDLDAFAPRSWGRFDRDGEAWQHRITVPSSKAASVRARIEGWLAVTNIDATVG